MEAIYDAVLRKSVEVGMVNKHTNPGHTGFVKVVT